MDEKMSQTNTIEEVIKSDLKQINQETKSLAKLKDSPKEDTERSLNSSDPNHVTNNESVNREFTFASEVGPSSKHTEIK